jgi:hypothetical protein
MEISADLCYPSQELASLCSGDRLRSTASRGCLKIDQVVFEPKHLISLLDIYSIPPPYGDGTSITANNQAEVAELLEAALGDWIDFIFIPIPKPIVIFADHDEYTTFFADTRSSLNRVVTALFSQGFKEIRDYKTHF